MRASLSLLVLLLTATMGGFGCAASDASATTNDENEVNAGTCIYGDGLYCGGNGVPGDKSTLYQCRAGRPSTVERCAAGCVAEKANVDDHCQQSAGQGDAGPAAPAANETLPCPDADGVYCGGNGVEGPADTLYSCVSGKASAIQRCANGCAAQAGGLDDFCKGGAGETCAPSRATGVVGQFQKALHDTIAEAEGTAGFSNDGYDVMFSFKTFASCSRHPDECLPFGNTCSTAAGRYQYLTFAWDEVAAKYGFTTFEPENQEAAVAFTVTILRGVTVPQHRAMTAAELSNALEKLSWGWASLPPSRYGQGKLTEPEVREMYCRHAGC